MRQLIILAAVISALVIAACGGGGGDSTGGADDPTTSRWPDVLELSDREFTPLPLNSQIIVGDSRFLLGLLDSDQQLVLGADLTLRFVKIENEEGQLKAELPATYISLIENFVHEHEDGTGHTHEGPEVGAYTARVPFDEPGSWGVQIDGVANGVEIENLRVRFSVLDEGTSTIPAIGAPAPPSEQVTLQDVADISEIDTANPPHPDLHDTTIAAALATGRPIVVAFTTPAFCVTRICGPVLDEVIVPLSEADKYKDNFIFIHVEPYLLDIARAGGGLEPVQALLDWGLPTEPWVFVIDEAGNVAAKFEGFMNISEVESALVEVLN